MRPSFSVLVLAAAVMWVSRSGVAQSTEAGPSITSIRLESTNVVVSVRVPEGLRRVTLECRERLGNGTWEPRIVARLDGAGGTVAFRLPRARQGEMMRVRAEASDPLPAEFYSGTNEFYEVSTSGSGLPGAVPGVLDTFEAPPSQAPREVVESDIWRIRGRTLYFFNQLRGLQVIDLADPDSPELRGTVELPAVGEDLYTLGADHVLLLARQGCSYQESEVIVVVDRGGTPVVVKRLPVSGVVQESRLVGTALYVVSSSYRPAPSGAGSIWEWGTWVSAFDLADPEAPVARDPLWVPGFSSVVTATDRLLFIVTQDPTDWWRSTVQSIDITSPDGTLRRHEVVRTAGRVPDKFKLQWDGNVLTTVSEDWRSTPNRRVTTLVETFRWPDPRSAGPAGVVKLGQLEVGRGEQLHATRFDGSRLYIVTFFRIDPLWVIDLSIPTSPRIAGSVDVPGWSTYIRPLGDRLVTIGVETNQVAVSLFDVADPGAPVLADRVRLGQKYSWSEANWDEQAFSVLPEARLVLVPFSGDTTNGYASSVQLIDLGRDSLIARGRIDHRLQPRRATLHDDRVLSISGWELLSVDITDRELPVVRKSIALAWPVDRVFLTGEYLLQLGGAVGSGWWNVWGSGEPAVLRVARADAPDSVLAQVDLAPVPVLGATVREAKLYVAQGLAGGWGDPFALPAMGVPSPESARLRLAIYDLGALPAVPKLGETESTLTGAGFGGQAQMLWPRGDVLVLAGGGFNWFPPCLSCPVPLAADRAFWPGPGFSGGGRLVAFDVSQPAAPGLASEIDLSTNGGWNFSPAFAAGGLVYLSHQRSYFLEEPVAPDALDPNAVIAPALEPKGTWVARSYLDVVDFADPQSPGVRRPVNVPGRLNGVSHGGSLLYTTGTRWTSPLSSWTESLAVSSYDGVSVRLVDRVALPDAWPHPVLVAGPDIFIGWPDYGTNAPATAAHSLQTWRVSMTGKLVRTGRAELRNPANVLAHFGELLAVQQTDNELALFDAVDGANLTPVGGGRPGGCQWADLTHADGARGRGVWVPLGAYGVASVPAAP